MAKVRGKDTKSPGDKASGSYQADKKAQPLTPGELRELAADMRAVADSLDSYANGMESLDIKSVTLFKKGIVNGIQATKDWIAEQFQPRYLKAGKDAGAELRIEFVIPNKQKSH